MYTYVNINLYNRSDQKCIFQPIYIYIIFNDLKSYSSVFPAATQNQCVLCKKIRFLTPCWWFQPQEHGVSMAIRDSSYPIK